MSTPIDEQLLRRLYIEKEQSMKQIADRCHCSLHKVEYWMNNYGIPRRSISDGVYRRYHPNGDPFVFDPPRTFADWKLFGMGIGLYWGEGTKANKYSVRLGNTDPELLRTFLEFLVRFFRIKKVDCRFGLQVFTDMEPTKVLDFWSKKLKIPKRQFYKLTVTRSGSLGTYRKKSQYGVVTIYYHNRKLRDLLVSFLHHRSSPL
ncbi:hypothetical protein EXS65_00010 [Candidatus Peribacteria bacterium]|nr:hypothetical protein [Candidatus Peribacteria bacterium]